MAKRFRDIVLGIIIGFSLFLLVFSRPRFRLPSFSTSPPSPLPSLVQVSESQKEIANSRRNAIVIAAQKVSPAVVSITVTQIKIVSSPFYSPFSDPFWSDFFRDFFPQRRFKEEIQGLGSGVIISPDGYIVTNAHVVEMATEIKVTLPDKREFSGRIIDLDQEKDLALLKIEGKNLPYAELGNSDDLMIGEWAIALGNPFGMLIQDAKPTVTVGVISALNRTISSERFGRTYENMIQTDAAINPGNSGGPLINANGEVIGINTFIFTHAGGSEGIGFAIPINTVKKFVLEAKEQKPEETPEEIETKLGITVSNINRALKKKYRLTTDQGVVIVRVKPNTIGEAIGLEEGDVIILVNNQKPNNARNFKEIADKLKNRIDMIINRQGEEIRIFYRY
ncbi:MAG: trypsin-like peptidase domain-containing protein [candidate division WOR-3 bacterium]